MITSQTTESLLLSAERIRRGGVIAFRTDTFYGLGADPFNQTAVQKILTLKGREDGKPILVLISDREHLDRLISQRSAGFDLLAKEFWPGPLTLIGAVAADLPPELTAGTKSVGVRLPDDDRVCDLVRACGGALTATSANPSGLPPARTAADVHQYFGEQIELVIDGGATGVEQPSTVVDVTTPDAKLIREGIISWPRIHASLAQL